jgi:flagellar biosynthesis protein FliQ
MTPEKVFSLCNMLAPVGWLILIFAGKNAKARLVAGVVIPLLLAAIYLVLITAHFGESTGSFSTLAGVAALFSDRWLLLAGWVHYLAFDLFTGAWQVRDAQLNAIPHLLVIPCLVLTFLFGPVGLLLYFGIRTARRRAAPHVTLPQRGGL